MKHHAGRFELICGSMFSGKTEELIRRLRRARIARQHVQVFKHSIDMRYDKSRVASHSGTDFEAIPVKEANEIFEKLDEATTVVGIDEVQFFDDDIITVIEALANQGRRVIVAGLDLDFRAEPFGPMAQLICRAEYVDKLHAICMVCGEEACRTQRLVNGEPAFYDDPIILVGASEAYEPRCRKHHVVLIRDEVTA